MKKILKITFYLSFVLAIGLFNGCEETDDYDYNSINPVVQGIVGSSAVRGGTTMEYRAVGRGGSSYVFSSSGAVENLSTVDDKVSSISVQFAESFEDAEAVLSVVETTMGGKESPVYEIPITVTALDINMIGSNELSVIEDAPVEKTYTVDFNYPEATYTWSLTGEDVEIVGDNTSPSFVVKYNYPTESIQTAEIAVQVTTRKGNTISDNMDITFARFCPYPMEDFVGNYTGTTDAHAETVTTELTDNLNELRVYELANFVQTSWGENWVEGDGSAVMVFSCGDVVTIAKQWIGDSDFPDSYEIEGSGTVDVDAKTITLVYEVFYTGGSVPDIETTLTLDAKSAAQILSFDIPKK